MKVIISIACILGLCAGLTAQGQSPKDALARLNARLPQEKIYIHFDKDRYQAGETVWFKAYLYNSGLPGVESHNLYLQLVDPSGVVVQKKVYPVAGATANGSIDLPDSLPTGSYYIRAVTPRMMNLAEDLVYRKSLPIYNPLQPVATANIERKPISLQFYPESGNLVDGVITIVGFKALDKWGYPANVTGVIRTTTGTGITTFKTTHDGIGRLQFKPVAGLSYVAEVEMDGKKFSFPLPPVQAGGVSLRVQEEKGGKLFQLSRGNAEKEKFNDISLIVQHNNEVVYRNDISFDDYPSVRGHLGTDSLPPGILHFTVLDATGNVIAERLSFVHNPSLFIDPDFKVVDSSMDRRGMNQYQLSFPENVNGVFSVSVTDASLPLLPDRENIYSRFLLSSDLKDHVHNPAFYFERNDDSTKRAMDNLLLTQKWTRFQWPQLLRGEMPTVRYNDGYLRTISGYLTEAKSGDRVSTGTLSLFLEGEDSSSQSFNVPVSADGTFRLDSILFYGNGRIMYLYSQGKKAPAVQLHLDPTKLDSLAALLPGSWKEIRTVMPGRDVVLNSLTPKPVKKPVVAEVVTPKESKRIDPKSAANEKYATGVWKTSGRVVYDESLKVNENTSVMEYILQNIGTVKMQGGQLVNMKNYSVQTGQHWPVGTYLEENVVTISNLASYRMGDIGLIKFFEAGFVGVGTIYSGGAVSVYRKKNGDAKTGKELPSVPYSGYSLYRPFIRAAVSQGLPDKSGLLFWEPVLYVDSASRVMNIQFPNNDTGKKIRVVVEGFDATGKLLYFERIVGKQ